MPQNYCIATGNKILFVRKYHFRRVHPQIISLKLHSDLRQFASKFNKPGALRHRPHHKKVLPLPPFLFLPLPLDSHRPRAALNRPGNEQRALSGANDHVLPRSLAACVTVSRCTLHRVKRCEKVAAAVASNWQKWTLTRSLRLA